MATAAEIRAAVDARLANIWQTIQTRQANYHARTGHYWQGLRTHAVTPADGVLVTPDRLNTKPTDQPETWAEMGTLPDMDFVLTIDTYGGPLGDGYIGRAEVTINGQVWERQAQVGPETWHQHPWRRKLAAPVGT